MRSYHLRTPGGLDGLTVSEHPVPRPGPTELLVRVRAAALNRRDTLILDDRYPLPSRPGVIPLSDGAGEVVAVGERVTRFRAGDRVVGSYWPRWTAGRLHQGLYDQLGNTVDGLLTEYAVLDQEWAVAVPESLSWVEAATLPCAAVTAWTSLTGGRGLRPGATVLTLGSGGVSLFALQLAKAMGCRVVVTTTDPAKAGRLTALGADLVVDTAAGPEWSERVREFTAGEGVDLVVETVGPVTFEQSMRAVGLYGEVVFVGGGAAEPELRIRVATYARTMATIRRVFVGSREDLTDLVRAVDAFGVRPVIDSVFPFDRAREAYGHFRAGRTFGKVVVEID
ncbi:zinc-dependent alcohol dehydrogenase family protein [Kitasatospora viridis]|uniref:NADPH:quinone reductase-like Zn-dependent oxidoreductase n=1 Tax=Kitasatospora viridis TaxID=281105 RepID=A0A561ULG4_9ACTN|nr:NAD(P)-dependent alcohol dehydrogenase [Kitasatospora viridis]TWG00211.1 NADPH:quinone reductase-like Zn-dependent oxidoreductase [Kitasatospora viridis]